MQYILLRGIKEGAPVQMQSNEEILLENNREKGEFRLIIPINPTICVLRDGTPKFEVRDGVLTLTYDLQKNHGVYDDF
jgi:hypothetical protein